MANTNDGVGFSDQERVAMRSRSRELAAEQKANKKREDGEKTVVEAIAAMEGNDQVLAQRIHQLVTEAAPDLWPKTWYGMPAYARDGKVVCFFQAAKKFDARYATLGFNDAAHIDEGSMWPTSFALVKLGPAEEQRILELVKKSGA